MTHLDVASGMARPIAAEWPRISIVTPTFNGAAYLERCILSVLEQNYPNVEYIVIDGGSRDGSVDVLKRYDSRINYWVSEKDRGQAHAINKGFARATGEIVNWLCSDDRLMPGALEEVGRRFRDEPDLDVLVGGCIMRYLNNPAKSAPAWTYLDSIRLIPCTNPINQPSCFYRRRILRKDKPVDESYNYAMDTELWSYFLSKDVRWDVTEAVLSEYLWTGENKTMTGGQKILRELDRLNQRCYREWPPLSAVVRIALHPTAKYAGRHYPSWRWRIADKCHRTLRTLAAAFYGHDRVRELLQTYRFFDPIH